MAAPLSAERLALLRLSLVTGVGPRILQNLLSAFPHVQEIFTASSTQLREVEGVGPKIAAAILAAAQHRGAEEEWERCARLGVTLYFRDTPEYPAELANICDPPGLLYCRGEMLPQDRLALAVVGSRRCTHYGQQQAERLSGTLARAGVTIVSGLARGIDAAAHRGALAAGGRTLAVMATGLSTVYPPEHQELAEQVAAQGALLTESCLDQSPVAGLFPQRNRIISGLSQGVLVVEATRNSGALHTARHAMEQGREVFALPGRIDSLASEGCHDLLRDGATLVRHVDDILESLGPCVLPIPAEGERQVRSPRELTLSDQERLILNLVPTDPTPTDEILRQVTLEASRVLATLTVLEMKRMIRRLPGGQIVRL